MKIILPLLFILIVSCSSMKSDNGVYEKSTSYKNSFVKSPPRNWKKINNEGSDFALESTLNGNIFIINSACRKYVTSNLPNLTQSILSGIDNLDIIKEEIIHYQDRDAVLLKAKGSIDGVTRFFKLLTLQKNSCIYDFILIANTLNTLEQHEKDFDTFINGIQVN